MCSIRSNLPQPSKASIRTYSCTRVHQTGSAIPLPKMVSVRHVKKDRLRGIIIPALIPIPGIETKFVNIENVNKHFTAFDLWSVSNFRQVLELNIRMLVYSNLIRIDVLHRLKYRYCPKCKLRHNQVQIINIPFSI